MCECGGSVETLMKMRGNHLKTINDHYRVSFPYPVKGVNCAPRQMVGRRFMGSRYGKTTPILLTGIAIAALCLVGIFLMQRGEKPPVDPANVSAVPSSSSSEEKPSAHLELPDLPTPAPAAPATFTDADAKRLKEAQARLSEVVKEYARTERGLQGARYAAMKANPEFKTKLDQAQTLKREVAAMIGALPEMKQIEVARERDVAKMQTVQGSIRDLERKIADGRKVRTKAVAAGQPSLVEEEAMRQMLTQQRQLKKDSASLRRVLLSHIKDVRVLQMESEKNHPEISVKSAEAERIRKEVSAAIQQSQGVASLFEKRDALQEERKALIRENSALVSRSNRVAAASQGEGES
jgi:hypothetical protein